jgi:hypothetical protein
LSCQRFPKLIYVLQKTNADSPVIGSKKLDNCWQYLKGRAPEFSIIRLSDEY